MEETPWVDYLPEPGDAAYRSVRQAELDGLTPTEVQASVLEGPTVIHSVRMKHPELGYAAKVVPTPDPRRPLRTTSPPLWRWEGIIPNPALDRAPSSVLAAVVEIARGEYKSQEWLRLGIAHGPSATRSRPRASSGRRASRYRLGHGTAPIGASRPLPFQALFIASAW